MCVCVRVRERVRACVAVVVYQGAPGFTGRVGAQGANGSRVSSRKIPKTWGIRLILFDMNELSYLVKHKKTTKTTKDFGQLFIPKDDCGKNEAVHIQSVSCKVFFLLTCLRTRF